MINGSVSGMWRFLFLLIRSCVGAKKPLSDTKANCDMVKHDTSGAVLAEIDRCKRKKDGTARFCGEDGNGMHADSLRLFAAATDLLCLEYALAVRGRETHLALWLVSRRSQVVARG
jgi:hypothetical protein